MIFRSGYYCYNIIKTALILIGPFKDSWDARDYARQSPTGFQYLGYVTQDWYMAFRTERASNIFNREIKKFYIIPTPIKD